MAEINYKEIKTKVALKILKYSEWELIKDTYKPLRGEVCLCEIGSTSTEGSSSATNPPTVLFKVGNGTSFFSGLNWVSALAADVYSWAKKTEAEFSEWVKTLVPLTLEDKSQGKFITGIAVSGQTITVTRSDVNWSDVKNAPDFALKNEIPTELGVMSVKTEGDSEITTEPTESENGDVTIKVTHATHAKGSAKNPSATDIKGYGAGGVIKIPKIETNEAGHITSISEETVEIQMPGSQSIPTYSIVKDAAAESGYAATYHLTKDGENVGASINIPKDMVVESGEVKTLNAGTWGAAGTYIVLTLANATSDKLYINVDNLIEYVTSGSTTDSQVIVSIDENHKITATIGAGKIGATELAQTVKEDITKGTTAHGWGNHANAGYLKSGDINGKADKKVPATAGNLASLDASGNLADSGKKVGDFATANQGTKADNALQEVEVGDGLKVSAKANNKQTIEIDTDFVFVINCNF